MKTIKRTFEFAKDYVSCLHCACNYGQDGKSAFCQVFSFHVDDDEIDENEKRAVQCKNYIPRGMNRSKTKTPDVERWYEKDSMG